MKNAALSGKPYAGNPHVRFDEGEVASAKPRRGSLLYNKIKLSCVLAVLCAAASVFATDYYVNTNGGVDDTAEGRGQSPELPYATIGYALGKAKTSGDHVYVAEGTYQERDLTVAGGVGLIATGRRDYTILDANASETDNARCIEDLPAKAYVKGFTIQNGWTTNNGGGVKANANAAVIDCAIRNCRGARGGGGNGGIWIRCYFASDNVAGWNVSAKGVYGPAFVANCVFDGAGCVCDVHGVKVVNCTFSGTTYVGTNDASKWPLVYNSIVRNIQTGAGLYRSVTDAFSSTASNLKEQGDDCRFSVDVTAASIARNADYIPLPTAADLLDKGNFTSYTNAFPEAWREIGEWEKGYGNTPRTVGAAIDIGAGEYSPWTEKGLEVSTEDLGDGRTRLSISQNPAGDRYLSGFTFDGEPVSFDVNMPGWTWQKVFDDNPKDHVFVPVYAFENCYYVDASRPSDDDTGIGRFHAFKTIQAAMEKVAKGGTVRVMPGTYSYRESATADGNGVLNVVVFKQENVTLESVRGAKWTVIEGNPIAGEGGVRCVNAAKSGSVVRGFTLRNGGTSVAASEGNGAGILNGTAVDCVIAGCRSKNRGGAAYNSTLVRCCLENCSIGNGSGSAMEEGKMYGCIVKGLTHYGGGIVDVNCTYIDGSSSAGMIKGNGTAAQAYNCLLIGGNDTLSVANHLCAFHNCIVTGKISTYDQHDDDCRIEVGTAACPYDPVTFRPLADADQINVGSNSYYESKFPAVYKDEYLDFAGGARIVDDVIDIGAGEYSVEAARLTALSQTLASDGRVTVTAADAEVSVTTGGKALIPSGASIAFDWSYPVGGTVAAKFTFTVEMEDGATLTLLEFGEVVRTITASGVYEIESPYDHCFVAEAAGGTVRLSGLRNAGTLSVVDANGRMTVSGASVGTMAVLPGMPVTATFSRTDHDQPLLTGVRVNGVFKPFSGDGEDVSQTVSVTVADDVTVEAVYEYALYVDAVNGDDGDGNDGKTPYSAKKTLAAAMALIPASAKYVVHAAPGTYGDGEVWVSGLTTNRVVVLENCGLVADQGPAVTVIEGKWADGAANGLGPDAIRCVYLKAGAWIQGFTLRGGATAVLDQYDEQGGGIYGAASTCAAIGCIVENCRAVRGGGIRGGSYIRCLMRGNAASDCAADSYNAEGFYECVFTSGSVYGNVNKIVNCTFVGTKLGGNAIWPHVYNSYVDQDDGKCHYHHCVWRTKKSTSSSTFDDDCVQETGAAAVALDENYRPLPTAMALVDQGLNACYVTNWPAAWSAETDIAGGQRVYNAAIDIGAGEYDWRSEFSRRLVGKRGEVTVASSGVAPGETGVVLADGESLTVDWTAKREGTQTFSATVTGEGALSVLLNGVPLTATDGVYSFEAAAGSVTHLEITFAGTGSAEVLKFCGPPIGMLLLVR